MTIKNSKQAKILVLILYKIFRALKKWAAMNFATQKKQLFLQVKAILGKADIGIFIV